MIISRDWTEIGPILDRERTDEDEKNRKINNLCASCF